MSSLKAALKRVPGLKGAYRALMAARNASSSVFSPYLHSYPAGHFYSPLPDARWVAAHRRSLFSEASACPGVDLREDHQLAVLDEMSAHYDQLPFPESASPPMRYYYENDFFSYGDAIVLYGMLRRVMPRRVIEVGSGFSSAVMLDTNERFLGGKVAFTFIDPYPQRLRGLLTEADERSCEVLPVPVQEVALERFQALEESDVLFIDSSHVAKVGSDVNHLLARVLPALRPGVVVHFHDVAWPFEYPETWVLEGRAWNEAYFLRAFLQFNSAFEMEYFNSFIAARHEPALQAKMPLCLRNPGGSLWVRRVR